MRNIILIAIICISAPVFAADNMLIFSSTTTQKMMGVVINEMPMNKLQQIFDYFGSEEEVITRQSQENDIFITCRRSLRVQAGSCTFRFIPSAEVQMQDNFLRAYSTSINTADMRTSKTLDLSFENLSGGQFNIRMNETEFAAEIRK